MAKLTQTGFFLCFGDLYEDSSSRPDQGSALKPLPEESPLSCYSSHDCYLLISFLVLLFFFNYFYSFYLPITNPPLLPPHDPPTFLPTMSHSLFVLLLYKLLSGFKGKPSIPFKWPDPSWHQTLSACAIE